MLLDLFLINIYIKDLTKVHNPPKTLKIDHPLLEFLQCLSGVGGT